MKYKEVLLCVFRNIFPFFFKKLRFCLKTAIVKSRKCQVSKILMAKTKVVTFKGSMSSSFIHIFCVKVGFPQAMAKGISELPIFNSS